MNDVNMEILKDPFLWTVYNRQMKPGVPYSNENYWFQKEILENKGRVVVVKKSAQLGMSELSICQALWFMQSRKENVLYCLPLDTNAKNFSKLKIDDVISQMPSVSQQVVSEKSDRRRKYSVSIKQFNESAMIILGMNGSRTTLESFSAGMVIFDEFSKVTDQGMTSVAKKRIKASKNKLERYFSTPLFPMDAIDRLYFKGRQKRWHITCDACGKLQSPNFFSHHNKLKNKKTLSEKLPHYSCESCSAKLNVLKPGKFIAKNPTSHFDSYHVNTVFVPHITYDEDIEKDTVIDSAQDIWNKYQEALEDPNEMSEFYRQELGEGYLSANDGISEEDIVGCQKTGRPIFIKEFMPIKGRIYAIGIDVGTALHIITIEVDPEDFTKGKIVDVKKMVGTDKFQELDDYIKYVRPNTGVIDMFPEQSESERVCNNNEKFNMKMAQFNGGVMGVLPKKGTHIVQYNRTMMFDLAFQKVKNRRRAIPQDIPKEFIEHFTNVIRREDGDKYTYTGRTGKKMPDHYLSAEIFAEMAISLISEQKKEADGRIVVI